MGIRKLAYGVAQWAQKLCGAATLLVPLTLKADIAEAQANFGAASAAGLAWCQHWAWLVIPVGAVGTKAAKSLSGRLGDQTNREELHKILDAMRSKIFSDAASPYQHYHRVTLFRYTTWAWVIRRWPWSGWLVPVCRPGNHTQKCKTYFKVPDNPDGTEGVAGKAWLSSKGVAVDGLPDLSSSSCSDAQIREYAEQTGMSERWTRKHRPTGRSFMAIKVLHGGKPWGVLVVDSRSDQIIRKKVDKAFAEDGGSYLSFFGKRL